MARFAEIRRELEAAREQPLGVLGAVEPHRDLGEHADRDDIGRRLLQMLAQARFGVRNIVRMQRRSRAHQRGIVHRVTHMLGIRSGGAGAIAGGVELVGQLTPGL